LKQLYVILLQALATPSSIATPFSRDSTNDRLKDSGMTTTPMTQDSQPFQLTQSPAIPPVSDTASESLLWVDKYKPTNIRQIIGQQGDKSNAKKLLTWLQNWHANLGRKPVCEFIEHALIVIIMMLMTIKYIYTVYTAPKSRESLSGCGFFWCLG